MSRLACFIAIATLASFGCEANPTTRSSQTTLPKPTPQVEKPSPSDPLVFTQKMLQMNIYVVSVPRGSISASEAFWKPVDENALDFITRQTMQANGLRVGVLPRSEASHLQEYIADPNAKRYGLLRDRADDYELPMRANIPDQHIAYFTRQQQLRMETFDRSDNLFYLSYRQLARKADTVNVTVTPSVRGLEKRIRYSSSNTEQPYTLEVRSSLYDLGVSVDLPMQHVLVVAPSIDANTNTMVGRAFMVEDGGAQQMEKVLLFIPESKSMQFKVGEIPPLQ